MSERAEDLVPLVDDVTWRERRHERVRRAVTRTEALGTSGLAVAAPADRLMARAAEPVALRYDWIGQHGARRIAQRHRWHRNEVRAEPPASTATRRRATRRRGA